MHEGQVTHHAANQLFEEEHANSVQNRATECGSLLCKSLNAHLSLLDRHRLASGRRLLVNAGEKVLGDPQGVLQERVVWVAGGRVFEQVLEYRSRQIHFHKHKCAGKRAHNEVYVYVRTQTCN